MTMLIPPELCACGKPFAHEMKTGERVCYGCFYDLIRERFGWPESSPDETEDQYAPDPYQDSMDAAHQDAIDEGLHEPKLATDGDRWGER